MKLTRIADAKQAPTPRNPEHFLKGDAVIKVYFVSDPGHVWTGVDQSEIEEKLSKSLTWLETQAAGRGVALNFRAVIASPVRVSIQIDESDAHRGPHNSKWQNQAVSRVLNENTSVSGSEQTFRARNTAAQPYSFVSLFFVKRKEGEREVGSVSFPYRREDAAEFSSRRAIVYDTGSGGQQNLESMIAHALLYLYNANSLRGFDGEQDDIMQDATQRPVEFYKIGDRTAYALGWSDVNPDATARSA